MPDPFLGLFGDPYFQRVVLTALLVAGVAAVLGVFLVLRGLSLFGDGIAHVSFAGVALALATGWMPLGTTLAVACGGAVLIQELRRRGIVRGDAAIGIVFTTALAVGFLIATHARTFVDLESYLFGSIYLSGDRASLMLIVGTALAVLVALLPLWRPFFAITFNQEAAEVQGLPVRTLDTLFTLLTAAAVVVAARVVGVLLISSLVIVPAATALQFARGFRAVLVWSPLVALAAVLLGFLVSTELDWTGGASITVASTALFLVGVLVSKAATRPVA